HLEGYQILDPQENPHFSSPFKMAIEVMDKRIRTFADRQTENKRKQDNNQQPQQQHQNKRQNTDRAYAAGTISEQYNSLSLVVLSSIADVPLCIETDDERKNPLERT
ncbi:hypothetical protein Tco_0565135, partial [Tanacetum coccineum]